MGMDLRENHNDSVARRARSVRAALLSARDLKTWNHAENRQGDQKHVAEKSWHAL
jgi:hypothetical protein